MNVSVGSFIEYIVCKQPRDGADRGGGHKGVAQRAYHIKEIEKSMKDHPDDPSKALQVDREWYLEQQILPPVGRYCDPIEGVHIGQLAQALGLNADRYKHLQRGNNGGAGVVDEEEDLEDKILRITNPLQKYKDICAPLKVKCRHCRCSYDFGGVYDFRTPNAKCGLVCPSPHCKGIVAEDMAERKRDVVAMKNSLSLQIWKFVNEYYGREWICLDLSCSFRTRQIPLNGTRCPKLGCSANMKESYSASQLFDQLRYFAFLFDRVEQTKLLKIEQQSNSNFANTALTRTQEMVFDDVHRWIKTNILERSRYYLIDCAVIFKYLM
jgi:DNA polymerase alpha subunit A